jgi:DNA-binding CsgD family transcriptional regulator/PAS domain-containing protein
LGDASGVTAAALRSQVGIEMVDDTTFERLVARWNRAALDPSHWSAAVGAVAGALGAELGSLTTPLPDPAGRFLFTGHGERLAEGMPLYMQHWVAQDPWLVGAAAKGIALPAGSVSFGREVIDPAALHRSAFYNEFGKTYGLDDVISLTVCDEHDAVAPTTRLSFFKTGGADFDRTERELLQTLWPHLQRAVQSHWLLRKAREHDRIAEQTLDAVPHPAWVLRADATIEHANPSASALMREAVWVGTQGGRLARIGSLDSGALVAALARGAAGTPPVLATGCASGGRWRRAKVHISPVRGQPAYATAWPHASALLMLDLPPPEQLTQSWLHAFARHHRLTIAETQVLTLLARGHDVPAIAETLGVAYSTARTHMATLLAKTGCARQADLTRKIFEA